MTEPSEQDKQNQPEDEQNQQAQPPETPDERPMPPGLPADHPAFQEPITLGSMRLSQPSETIFSREDFDREERRLEEQLRQRRLEGSLGPDTEESPPED